MAETCCPKCGNDKLWARMVRQSDRKIMDVCVCCDLADKQHDCPHVYPEDFAEWNRKIK